MTLMALPVAAKEYQAWRERIMKEWNESNNIRQVKRQQIQPKFPAAIPIPANHSPAVSTPRTLRRSLNRKPFTYTPIISHFKLFTLSEPLAPPSMTHRQRMDRPTM
ncbi:hypothetical protein FRC10_000245 [Ceratobasidium sp. 414]|nr:hypothetical protein FRC10_000245 [Ceratobasidium sp. 414]